MEDKAIDYVIRILDISLWYYTMAVIIGVVVWKTWTWEGGLLAGYTFFLLAETVLIRKPFQGIHFQPELFWSWKEWNVQREQILTNIVMFIPVGILTGGLWEQKGLFVDLGLSVGIETLQLLTTKGLCEFDDVVHNMIGATVGILIIMLIKKVTKRVEGI